MTSQHHAAGSERAFGRKISGVCSKELLLRCMHCVRQFRRWVGTWRLSPITPIPSCTPTATPQPVPNSAVMAFTRAFKDGKAALERGDTQLALERFSRAMELFEDKENASVLSQDAKHEQKYKLARREVKRLKAAPQEGE